MKFDYKSYRSLLDTLLDNHQPVTFVDRFSSPVPRFIMRHDIDRGLEFLGEIPAIEKELGVRATYFIQVASDFYNPFCPNQSNIIEQLISMGHRLGLHFDCLKGDVEIPEDNINFQINREMALLKAYWGLVDAVSFHQPSRSIINNSLKIEHVNTYDREDMAGFEYFSDSAQKWSKGNPMDFIRMNSQSSFQILTHPFLWNDEGDEFEKLAVKAICGKAQRLYDYDKRFARGMNDNLKCIFTKVG